MSDVEGFMTELLALCVRHGITRMEACSCCSGVRAYVGDDQVAEDITVTEDQSIRWYHWTEDEYREREIAATAGSRSSASPSG